MAKSSDIIEKIYDNLEDLSKKMESFSAHQKNMIENYDILMQNQLKTTDNHDIVIQNQKTIIKNQGIITQNQSSIINNQSLIVKNQAYLKTFLHTQTEILTLLTNRPKEEIAKEINDFFEKSKNEISVGLESVIE